MMSVSSYRTCSIMTASWSIALSRDSSSPFLRAAVNWGPCSLLDWTNSTCIFVPFYDDTRTHTLGHCSCCTNHSLLHRGSRVFTATGFVYRNHWFWIPLPHKFHFPWLIDKKLSQVITLATATRNQIWCKSPNWELLDNCVKYNQSLFIYYLYPLFRNSSTGQTGRQIFVLDGSN